MRDEALKEVIRFGQSDDSVATPELIHAVNNFMNQYSSHSIPEFEISHRRIAAKELIIDSIYALNRAQLLKVEYALLNIANTI